MTDASTERHTSYGRGGAGNLRRPSATAQAKEILASLTSEQNDTEPAPQRRRSSVWSLGSSNGERRRSSAWKWVFRRGSTSEEPEVEKIEE